MGNMFCFQCEQTAGGKGCTGLAGVCGKKADTAVLLDELTGTLITLARAVKPGENTPASDRSVITGLFTAVTNVAFDSAAVAERISETKKVMSYFSPVSGHTAAVRRIHSI